MVNMHTIKMNGSSLYITPKPVIVKPEDAGAVLGNKVNGVYSHALWWYGNQISSDNVTIIAGSTNVVGWWNENATVLWWEGNIMNSNAGEAGLLVWWWGNSIKNNGSVIWWEWNSIGEDALSTSILWWENNKVINWDNVIVWGKNIEVKDCIIVISRSNNDIVSFCSKISF